MGIKIHEYQVDDTTKYAARSSITDSFLCFDMTKYELIEWWVDRAKERAIEEINNELVRKDKGISFGFIGDDVEEMIEDIDRHFELKNCKDEDFNADLKLLRERLKGKKKKKS